MKFTLAIIGTVIATSLMLFASEEKDTSVVLKKTNTIVLNEQVDDLTVARVTQKAFQLDETLKKGEPIYLYIFSPGGSISAGLELCSNLKALKRPVNTITSFAASMGFQIAQCLGERLILSHGEMMSHHASGSFGVLEFGGKEPTQMTSRYQFWVDRIKKMDELTVTRSKGKQTLQSYQEAYENELWIEGQSAVNAGYADKVVTPSCDKSLSGTKEVPIQYMGVEIVLIMSECPLINGPVDYYVNILTNRGTVVKLENFKKLGGQFGNGCVSQNITQMCSQDVTLTLEKIEDLKNKALNKAKLTRTDVIRGY